MNERIAYLILAYNDPNQLHRLIRALNFNSDFFVHIDKKSDIKDFSFLFNYKNVFVVNDRVDVSWGGFSVVNATKKLVLAFLNYEEECCYSYKKVLLLSGVCYPIKNNKEIHSFFDENKAINFIKGMNVSKTNFKIHENSIVHYHYYDVPSFRIHFIKRVLRRFLFWFSYIIKKSKSITIDGKHWDIYHGSQWWALNVDVLRILSQKFNNEEINNYFKYSMASDENYFHTLYYNSDFDKEVFKGHKRTSFFANLHVIHPSLSKWYDDRDFYNIIKSKKLFVRKVSTIRSSILLDLLDSRNEIKKD